MKVSFSPCLLALPLLPAFPLQCSPRNVEGLKTQGCFPEAPAHVVWRDEPSVPCRVRPAAAAIPALLLQPGLARPGLLSGDSVLPNLVGSARLSMVLRTQWCLSGRTKGVGVLSRQPPPHLELLRHLVRGGAAAEDKRPSL